MRLSTSHTALLCLALALVLLLEVTNGQSTERQARQRGNQAARRRQRGNNRNNANNRGGNRPPPPGCEEIHVPMCKGLVPYVHTKLPNMFNHTTQLEVYRHLEHLWAYMDHSCSKNTRLLACSMYLPKCTRRGPPIGPCKRLCMAAKRRCARPLNTFLGLEWATKFSCRGMPSRRCIRPTRERRCRHEHPTCVRNSPLSVCANLTFTWGTLPNMYQQCHMDEMETEMQHYHSLISSNCHQDLRFLLCGVYSPYCVRGEVPFTFPCRELCDEVRQSCEATYRRLNHNLPWPNKLQCHRFPLSTDDNFDCVMPREGSIFGAV